MKYLFAKEHAAILEHFAWSKVLLAFDYDGTLAPIVAVPDFARMRRSTQKLLDRAAKMYPCAVISGRGRLDARKKLDGVRVDAIVGNHGLEPSDDHERYQKIVRGWMPLIERAMRALPGALIEDKRYSVALHYRHCRQKRAARAAIARLVKQLGPARVIEGKLVVNVLPEGAPHKGVALRRIREELGCDTALYVGDDVTDEDVFALDEPGQLISIRVGQSKRSQAQYYIKDQLEIDRLLEVLCRARAAFGKRVAK